MVRSSVSSLIHLSCVHACSYVAFRVPRVQPTPKEDANRPLRVMVYAKMMNPAGGYPEFVDTAYPLLMNLPQDLWKGGPEAEMKLAAMVATALAPYRKLDLPINASEQCFELVRYSQGAQSFNP